MIDKTKRVSVGVGVLVWNEQGNKILLGKRKSEFGKGFYSLPGGKMDFGEKIIETAARELLEEANLVIDDPSICGFTEDQHEGRHWLTMYVEGHHFGGELRNMEPDKCEGWEWYDVKNLPEPLWQPVRELFEEIFQFI